MSLQRWSPWRRSEELGSVVSNGKVQRRAPGSCPLKARVCRGRAQGMQGSGGTHWLAEGLGL